MLPFARYGLGADSTCLLPCCLHGSRAFARARCFVLLCCSTYIAALSTIRYRTPCLGDRGDHSCDAKLGAHEAVGRLVPGQSYRLLGSSAERGTVVQGDIESGSCFDMRRLIQTYIRHIFALTKCFAEVQISMPTHCCRVVLLMAVSERLLIEGSTRSAQRRVDVLTSVGLLQPRCAHVSKAWQLLQSVPWLQK